MIYGSLCSGIEAATQAWHPLGWKPAFFSEIERFPSAVLAHHYPDIPNLGDMTKFKDWPDHAIDLLVGGTPCQSFSVAGLRGGLADPRGNLMLTFGAVAKKYQPRWLVWENVPGVLSSNGGRDFGTFLGMLAELGYGFAYRVLDAQHVRTRRHARAVPQRRRRVFVVGYLGDWRPAAAVLFDRESLSGNSAPRREAGEGVAGTIGARTCRSVGTQDAANEHLIASTGDVAHCLNAGGMGRIDYESETMVAYRTAGDGAVYDEGDVTAPLTTGTDQSANIVAMPWAVRRLMPVECERLQVFPDGFTDIPWRGGRAADGPRYKALGNSMAVNVMTWLGERIQMVEKYAGDARQIMLAKSANKKREA